MPELPEVETIVSDLAPLLTGARIIRVQVWDPLLVRFPGAEDLNRRLSGGIIRTMTRRGKYIVVGLDQGLTWLVHLRMTGRLLTKLEEDERHLRAQFTLDNGICLSYCDLRRFGDMWAFFPGEEEHLGGFRTLGPEPLSEGFSQDWLLQAFARRKAPVKALLLNQSIVAGLGNIYVDEALFVAGIHPGRQGYSLTEEECGKLAAAVKEVIQKAISSRGTTFRDYRSGLGTVGEYQQLLQVYGRKGEECTHCGTLLDCMRIGGRTSVYCPRCQKQK
jgi:formamidopyrimidine-DNA glycosylase